MPYRRKDRPGEGYRIRLRLGAPWHRSLGPLQTGTKNRQLAVRMEGWLRDVSIERPEVIDALLEKDLTFNEVWQARISSTPKRDDLQKILEQRKDPLLSVAAEELVRETDDKRTRTGLRQLHDLAVAVDASRTRRKSPHSSVANAPELRVSWICEPENIAAVYKQAMKDGRAPNSVRRSIHRAVTEIVLKHRGKARRDEIFSNVRVPGEKDLRRVLIDEEEIQALLDACDPDFRDFVTLAILLGIDRAPLLKLTPRRFNADARTVQVPDRKTEARYRTLQLPEPAFEILERRTAGGDPDDPIFSWTSGQVRHLWDAARDRAAGNPTRNQQERGETNDGLESAVKMYREEQLVTLPILRFKDLRHLLPTIWNSLGLSPRDLEEIMGWTSGSKMSARYTFARRFGDRDALNRVAAKLGFLAPKDNEE